MITVTGGEIIELNGNPDGLNIACFCSSSNSRITSYSRQIDPYFETLRALAGKHRNCEKLRTNFIVFCIQFTDSKLSL